MSFYNDGREFRKNDRPLQIVTFLLGLAVVLGVLLFLLQLVRAVVSWWNKPRSLRWTGPTKKISLVNHDFLSFDEQFIPLLLEPELEADKEEKVVLRLDESLLVAATQSANANRKWWLELNVDGEWNQVANFVGWRNLLTVRPEVWRYLLVYQSDKENIVGYDLRTLEEKSIISLDEAFRMINDSGHGNFTVPLDRIELLGVIDDQIYIYVHNPLNEGVMMFADYTDTFDEWQIWPGVKGRVARINGQSFLLQGFQEGCSAVYTFERILGQEKKLERLVTVYNGCVGGERFLGVDQQGRILLAEVKGETDNKGVNLDIAGNYVDLQAVSINEAGDRTRLLLGADMPSGIYHAVFFPGMENIADMVVVEDESSVEKNEASPSTELNNEIRIDPEGWRKHDQIVMTSQDSVWKLDLFTGELKKVANLMSLFGKPVIKSWEKETLCLEMTERPELSIKDKMISIDLETGVPVAGTEVCLRQGPESRPYVNSGFSRDDQEENIAHSLALPSDFRLVYGSKRQSESVLTQ